MRASGAIYEACAAALQQRARSPLYHSALVARVSEGSYFMEMTPVAKDELAGPGAGWNQLMSPNALPGRVGG